MAANLSNEYALDLTLNQVIGEAYALLQTIGDGETITGGLYTSAQNSLNIMLKLWESQGIHLWTMTEGSLFLTKNQAAYDFRKEGRATSAVHLANAFEQRALGAAMAVNDLQITLDGVADLAVGDQIGVLNSNNALEWFLVMEIAGAVVTLDHPVLLASAASGAVVYTYDYLNADSLTVANAGTAVLDVSDTTLFTAGDTVLVLLDSNSTDTRTVASVNQGANTITLTDAISGAAGIGNAVVNTTTRRSAFLPIKRILNDTVRRRESTDYEIPIVFQSRKDYFDLPNKNQSGTPIQAYYDRQQPTGVMYLWNPPASARSVINFTYERSIMVLTDPDHTFDLPVEWLDAIIYNLAKRLIPKVGCSPERKTFIVNGATEYLDNALGFDQAVYPIRLKPQQYG